MLKKGDYVMIVNSSFPKTNGKIAMVNRREKDIGGYYWIDYLFGYKPNGGERIVFENEVRKLKEEEVLPYLI